MTNLNTYLCKMERGLFKDKDKEVKNLENNTVNIIEDDTIEEPDYNKYEYVSTETIFTDMAGFEQIYIRNNGIYLQTYGGGHSQGGYVITPKNILFGVNCDMNNDFEMEYMPNHKIVHLKNEPYNILVVSKYYIPYENEIELDMELFWIKHRENFKNIQKIEEIEKIEENINIV